MIWFCMFTDFKQLPLLKAFLKTLSRHDMSIVMIYKTLL